MYNDALDEDVVSFTTDLSCSNAYVVSMRAFTMKGVATVSSSILIPKDEEGKMKCENVQKEKRMTSC